MAKTTVLAKTTVPSAGASEICKVRPIQKEDVETPPVETLELIPEPDGSATDDFVIPEWLEERENQKRFR